MLYLLRTNEELISVYDKLDIAIELLNDICESTLECYVLLDEDIRMKCGKEVRGRYTLVSTWFPCKPDGKSRGVIFLDEKSNFVEMCTVLVHEFAHHLTGEGHDGKLFNLFKDWLREKFVERWEEYYVERGKNQRQD
jgi:hypothetical protein